METYSETNSNYNNNNFEFPSIEEIYKKSIIDWDILYKSIAIISVESSNTFTEIENMEFFKYYTFSKYVIDYLEEKSKRENGEGDDSVANQHTDMMNSAKNQMSGMKNSFKTPSLGNLKLK